MKALPLWLVLAAAASAAFTPDLRHVQPRGAQRGGELVIRLHGERLREPRELLLQRPGIEVLSLEERVITEDKEGGKKQVRDGRTVLARIRISPNAPLGEHPLRLRTDGGVSYLRSFWIGPFPTLPEVEPNNDFDDPQEINRNVTVHGVIKTEDEDIFAVALKKEEPLSVEVEAMRLGRVFFDARVAILDPDGFEIASCDDATLLRTDAFVSMLAPKDGLYRISVREAAYQGSDASQYRLHVGSFPRPSTVVPPAARPGETIDFRFLGDPLGEITRTITIPADASGLFPVFAERDGIPSPSPNWIEVSSLPHLAETEPNNGPKQAPVPLVPPCAVHGAIGTPKDTDWFRFEAKKNRNYEIRVLARHLRSPLDAVIGLRGPDGKGIESNDDQDGPDSVIRWKCPADGIYELYLRDKLARSGPDYVYRLEVRHRAPAISAGLPVARRNDSQARKMVVIPRGNLCATPVNITRTNLGCAAEFEAVSLPVGVSIEVPEIPRSLNSFPLLFRAAADAPIEGGFHRFRIRSTGEGTPEVDGALEETIHHIEINNQGPYHSWHSGDIAVAVIKEAPFHVRLDPPGAPVVPRGTVKLGVGIDRHGCDGKVTLRLLWRPPGIGAPEVVPLAAKENGALYEINATEDAPVGEWKLAVLGEAPTPEGPVIVSSEFVTLRVVEPWLSASIALGATEQGRNTSVLCQLEHAREFVGEARAELIGLPHGATSAPLTFTHETSSLTFPVTVSKDAVVGKHSGLFLRIHIPHGDGEVLHQCAQGGVLRIDKPRPQVAAKPATPDPKPGPAKPTAKPLSRLEQLRRQAEEQ
ncbi:PPC domain-containing protein [Haloferula sp. A504]|uniref:PPC domain-containing protein n=1 Tax=Haloferula sp. A504 TaxID=3373601 RepID=UPI0031C12C19|nr:PPC domain-containing protein [Verrucomicrobiaceae bacterium E54]